MTVEWITKLFLLTITLICASSRPIMKWFFGTFAVVTAVLFLSFVAWIAKAHDGTVNVESEAGKGTTFKVTIPR